MNEKEKEQKRKEILERARNVGEKMAAYVPISKMEALIKKIEDPKFRTSIHYKAFINSL
jgi:hypothetical protein